MNDFLWEKLSGFIRQIGFGGIPEEAIDGQLPNNCRCVFCSNVTVKPVFPSECGHRYCRSCVLHLFYWKEYSSPATTIEEVMRLLIEMPKSYSTPAKDTEVICLEPDCKVVFNWESINPDAALDKRLSRLTFSCVNNLCDYSDKYLAYLEHKQNCPHAFLVCKFCWQQVKSKELNEHQMKCDKRPDVTLAECHICRKTVAAGSISEHINSLCPEAPINCNYCDTITTRCKLSEHQKTCLLPGRCIFGCDTDPGTNAAEHYDNFEVIHIQRLSELLSNTEDSRVLLKASYPLNYIINRLGNTHLGEQPHRSVVLDLLKSGTANQFDILKLINVVGKISTVQELRDKLQNMELVAASLQQSAESVYRAVQGNNELSKENVTYLTILKEDLEKQHVNIQKENIHMLERQVTLLNDKSIDGWLTWRVENISNLRNRQTRDKSIYSSPFYSATNGYKLRLRLFLNGDPQVEGKFMSLYVIICRGEYDAINKWPFMRTVELTCLDQRVSLQVRKHQSDLPQFKHFSCLLKSNDELFPALQRPKSEFNQSFGISKFLKIDDKLFQPDATNGESIFIKDDVMFIRAIVLPF